MFTMVFIEDRFIRVGYYKSGGYLVGGIHDLCEPLDLRETSISLKTVPRLSINSGVGIVLFCLPIFMVL